MVLVYLYVNWVKEKKNTTIYYEKKRQPKGKILDMKKMHDQKQIKEAE